MVGIDKKALSKLQDEVLLFSIAIQNPPTAAARVSGGKGQGGKEGKRVIGGGFAEELEESLTREERHIRACRFVAGVHRYLPEAKFIVHHEADMPERYMREVHEASGWRARFVAYEVVAKYWDVPVRPGAMPPPTGRLPAEAAAFLKRERDREVAEAVAATAGATEQIAGSDFQNGRPIPAGSLIGATFTQSFGVDGMWEGEVLKFLTREDRVRQADSRAIIKGGTKALRKNTSAFITSAVPPGTTASAAEDSINTPGAPTKANARKQAEEGEKSPPAAKKSNGGVPSEGAGPTGSAGKVRAKDDRREGKKGGLSRGGVTGVKRARSSTGGGVRARYPSSTASSPAGSPAVTGLSRPRTKSPWSASSDVKSLALASVSPRGRMGWWSESTDGGAVDGTGLTGSTGKGKGKGKGSLDHDSGMSVTAQRRFKIKAKKAAEGMAAQAAYERAKRQKLPPEEAARRLAEAAAEAAEAAGKSSSIGGNLSRHLSDLKAAEKSGRGVRGKLIGARGWAGGPDGGGEGDVGKMRKHVGRPRRLSFDDQIAVLRHAFWSDIWPALLLAGWNLQHVIQGSRHARFYFPPGISRGPGMLVRRDFFDSVKQLIPKVMSMPEWQPLCTRIIEEAQEGNRPIPSPLPPSLRVPATKGLKKVAGGGVTGKNSGGSPARLPISANGKAWWDAAAAAARQGSSLPGGVSSRSRSSSPSRPRGSSSSGGRGRRASVGPGISVRGGGGSGRGGRGGRASQGGRSAGRGSRGAGFLKFRHSSDEGASGKETQQKTAGTKRAREATEATAEKATAVEAEETAEKAAAEETEKTATAADTVAAADKAEDGAAAAAVAATERAVPLEATEGDVGAEATASTKNPAVGDKGSRGNERQERAERRARVTSAARGGGAVGSRPTRGRPAGRSESISSADGGAERPRLASDEEKCVQQRLAEQAGKESGEDIEVITMEPKFELEMQLRDAPDSDTLPSWTNATDRVKIIGGGGGSSECGATAGKRTARAGARGQSQVPSTMDLTAGLGDREPLSSYTPSRQRVRAGLATTPFASPTASLPPRGRRGSRSGGDGDGDSGREEAPQNDDASEAGGGGEELRTRPPGQKPRELKEAATPPGVGGGVDTKGGSKEIDNAGDGAMTAADAAADADASRTVSSPTTPVGGGSVRALTEGGAPASAGLLVTSEVEAASLKSCGDDGGSERLIAGSGGELEAMEVELDLEDDSRPDAVGLTSVGRVDGEGGQGAGSKLDTIMIERLPEGKGGGNRPGKRQEEGNEAGEKGGVRTGADAGSKPEAPLGEMEEEETVVVTATAVAPTKSEEKAEENTSQGNRSEGAFSQQENAREKEKELEDGRGGVETANSGEQTTMVSAGNGDDGNVCSSHPSTGPRSLALVQSHSADGDWMDVVVSFPAPLGGVNSPAAKSSPTPSVEGGLPAAEEPPSAGGDLDDFIGAPRGREHCLETSGLAAGGARSPPQGTRLGSPGRGRGRRKSRAKGGANRAEGAMTKAEGGEGEAVPAVPTQASAAEDQAGGEGVLTHAGGEAGAQSGGSSLFAIRKSGRRRIETNRFRDAWEGSGLSKQKRIVIIGGAEYDGTSSGTVTETPTAVTAVAVAATSSVGGGFQGTGSGSEEKPKAATTVTATAMKLAKAGKAAKGTGVVAAKADLAAATASTTQAPSTTATTASNPLDPTVIARPWDMYLCRYQDAYEEELSLQRLMELGAAFKKPPVGAAVAAAPHRPRRSAGDHKVGGGMIDLGPGDGRVWRTAAKPGAQRVLAAMSMATLWGHRNKDTVISASIHDDAEFFVSEIASLLMQMNSNGREVGITYWESPERKCLNDCRLPLPAEEEAFLANRSATAYASACEGGGGSGSYGGVGGGKAKAGGGSKAKSRGGQQHQIAKQEARIAWNDAPGGWKEHSHCHSGPVIIWRAGPTRARAKAKGDFVEHCCAALMSTAHVPPGAELMLVDGFLQSTGILETNTAFRPYRRRAWSPLAVPKNGSFPGKSTEDISKLPPCTVRLHWRKIIVEVGKVPRKPETLYVCSSRPVAIASAAVSAGDWDGSGAPRSVLLPKTEGNGCAAFCSQDETPLGTAPWAALNNKNYVNTNKPTSSRRGGGGGGVSPAKQPGDKHHHFQGPRLHFQACIVCQRLGGNGNSSSSSKSGGVGDGGGMSQSGSNSNASTCRPSARGPGPLLYCSTCPASFHLSCMRPRLRVMPKGAWTESGCGSGGPGGGGGWSCAYCYATGRAVGGDSDGACGAVRLMESLRQGMQNAVRVNTKRTLRYKAFG